MKVMIVRVMNGGEETNAWVLCYAAVGEYLSSRNAERLDCKPKGIVLHSLRLHTLRRKKIISVN